jgi:hypothetical protein
MLLIIPAGTAAGNPSLHRRDPDWMRETLERRERHKADVTARRLATLKLNGTRTGPRPRGKLPPAPFRFFVSPKIEREWFAGEEDYASACALLSLIHLQWVWRWKWRNVHGEPGWVRLKYAYLEQFIPRAVLKRVKETLTARGVLLCDGIAIRGEKAFGYRIAEPYRGTRQIFSACDRVNRRLAAAVARRQKGFQPVHAALLDCLRRVRIDAPAALREIARMRLRRKPRSTAPGQAPYTLQTYREDLGRCVKVIAAGADELTVDDYGRVHTPVTRLKRELARHLYFEGADGGREPVVWIDASCCQPLLIGFLARHYWSSSRDTRSRLCERTYGNGNPYRASEALLRTVAVYSLSKPSSVTTHRYKGGKGKVAITNVIPPQTPTTPILGKRGTPYAPARVDGGPLDEFIHLCEEGRIYHELLTDEERRRAGYKVRFLVTLYAADNPKHPNALRRRLAERFPPVAEFAAALRRKDHRRAARLMQNVESTLFIHRVCGRITRDRPDVPLLTKHDALGTTPQHATYVAGVIHEEFAWLGLDPTLKVSGPGITATVREQLAALGPKVKIQ